MAQRSGLQGVARPVFRCGECGRTAPRWVGRCPECQAWGTLAEVGAPRAQAVIASAVSTPARPIGELEAVTARARPTGVDELDRVLGGGLVAGAVVLLAGEPGVGKSTLLLAMAHRCAAPGARVLIVSGEESTAQVRLRAERMGALSPDLLLAAENDLGAVLGHIDAVAPALVIVDSVQTFTHPAVEGAPGGPTQVREVAAALIRVAKERALPIVLVGHVTKEGAIAGPRTLEHLVDVVLSFEGERSGGLRLLRAVKNRFGTTEEVGCFEMTPDGIRGLADPSGLFLSGRGEPASGTAVAVTLEGRRALVAEVQALAVESASTYPRRAVSGLDAARVAMLLAVLDKHARRPFAAREVYASSVGGVRITDPAADLALLMALASSHDGSTPPAGEVVIGEVGLAGEIRRVPALPQRLAEAARLGFSSALVPHGSDCGPLPAGLTVRTVATVTEALPRRAASAPK